MAEELTRRQQEVLSFLRRQIALRGYPPSVREIGEALGIHSTATVHSHLANLERKGYIRRYGQRSRAIELVELPDSTLREPTAYIPLIGKVTAGMPITAVENIEGYYPIPAGWARPEEHFLLRVSGESMIEAGILDGDLALVHATPTAANGDIVVALVNSNEVTIKRLFIEPNRIRLQPENPVMEPLFFDHVTIVGKVVGLLRLWH